MKNSSKEVDVINVLHCSPASPLSYQTLKNDEKAQNNVFRVKQTSFMDVNQAARCTRKGGMT